jgi:hypothetical protein
MSHRVHLGTRKGLFAIDVADDGTVSVPQIIGFLGASVPALLANPLDGNLYAALNHDHFGVKLHRSADHGANWEECAVPTYPAASDEKEKALALDEVWCLEHGGSDHPDRLWCGTIPGGLFLSTDRGNSWSLVESLWNCEERSQWFGGGKDEPGIHSICVDPRNGDHVFVAVSCGGVWRTTDGGQSWDLVASGMRAEYMPPERQSDGVIQDPHRMVQCRDQPDCFWVQHHNGIFRSTDACQSWTEIADPGVSPFGFATAVDPHNGDRAWFVPGVKDECRVPVDGKIVVTRTSDGGGAFDIACRGLPSPPAWDIVFRHCLDVDGTGQRLAMGSSTGGLWVSHDAGESWHCVTAHLPQVYCVRFESSV